MILEPLRIHAIELARANVLQELRAVNADDGQVDDNIQRNRRSRIQEKIRRLKPGATTAIAAMKCTNGDIVSSPELIAKELRQYWAQVFEHRPHDQHLLQHWIDEEIDASGVPFGDDTDWRIQRKHVAKAIDRAPDTMPGPDGIPYSAWKRFRFIATDIVWEAILALGEEDAAEQLRGMDPNTQNEAHSFNLGNMVFLPKKIAGHDPLAGDYYTAADTRPLVIVNTDNRIIANAIRIHLEPIVAQWISPMQRGFLPGRSMLANVIDIEHLSQGNMLKHDRGCTILFDFKAAFPSLCHGYLPETSRGLGIPRHICHMIKSLYDGHRCNIGFKGQNYKGFEISAGIRQGCPLSPLLFALVIDIFLRRIHRHIPTAEVRAFALILD